MPIIPVFFFSSALLAGALALVVWSLALLTEDRRVATIAAILVCAGGRGGLAAARW